MPRRKLPIFKVYILRRMDKNDPFYCELWQPFYVGKGKKQRETSHRKEALKLLKNPNATNTNPIRNAIIHKLWEQGLDFTEEVLFIELTNDQACEIEMEFIAKYGRICDNTGCLANLTLGGDGSVGYSHTEESLNKMKGSRPSVAGENNPNYGNYWSEEQKKAMSIKTKGRPPTTKGMKRTEEQNKRNSEAQKKRFENPENHPMKNKHHKEESKEKIREARKGKYDGENHWNYGNHWPEEVKQKMRESHQGEKNYLWGKTQSEETKQKQSVARKLWWAKKKAAKKDDPIE